MVRPLFAFYLKGSTYTDPIDGKSFRKFLPYGYGTQRPNVLSPSTLSLERHRLLWLYLQNETDFFTIKKPKKVLHMAPEQCFLKRFQKLKHIDLITADLYSPIVDVKADICDLPFDDNSFDIIFCNHVLEHIPDGVTIGLRFTPHAPQFCIAGDGLQIYRITIVDSYLMCGRKKINTKVSKTNYDYTYNKILRYVFLPIYFLTHFFTITF